MQNNVVTMFSPLSQTQEIQVQLQPLESMNIMANPMSDPSRNKVDFSDIVTQMVKSVDAKGQEASAKMTAVDLGKSDDLVGAMVASQTASLSFSAMVQVRNKVLSAYDDIMRMPV